MYGWGRFVHRFRWLVLLLSVLITFGAGYWGLGVFSPGVLKSGGFEDPGADSTAVNRTASMVWGGANPDVMLVYRSEKYEVTDPEYMQSVLSTIGRLPKANVKKIFSYWHIEGSTKEAREGRENIISHDRHSTLVMLDLQGDKDPLKADAAKVADLEEVKKHITAPGMTVQVGGAVQIGNDFLTQMMEDLTRAEVISLPLVLIIGIIVFGSVAAALQPVLVGIFSILGALAVMRATTMVVDVSSLTTSLVSMLAVGLAIDYSLFIINRFREELAKGRDGPTAMGITMATAGRTVMFSAVTVMASMAGLLLFPQMFLKSIGIAGNAVIVVALIMSLVVLPCMLSILGPRIEFGQMPWRKRRARKPRPDEEGAWYKLGHSVMKRPFVYFLGTSAILVALVTPFLHVQFGLSDIRSLPEGMPARVVVETVQANFSGGVLDPIDVLLEGALVPKNFKQGRDELPKNLADFRDKVAAMPNVTAAQFTNQSQRDGLVRMQVTYTGEANDEATKQLVRDLRALDTPQNRPEAINHIVVGGSTAVQMDLMDSLARSLPKTAAFVGVAIFILLFAAFGSILLPLKAVIMNLLSIGASFGAMVWAFQDAHLAGLLGFTPTGSLDANSVILVLAIVFGLSMDYEVFLLSRIREEWDRSHDNRRAVARGLQQTGGIITSAAVLLVVVVAAFSTAKITTVKELGVGLLVAVIVDATLVRSLLVPATMRFLGDANWWLPGPLKKLHAAIDLREVHDIDLPGAAPAKGGPGVTSATGPALNGQNGRPTRGIVPRQGGGYVWTGGGRHPGGQPGRRREIVADPSGSGWHWREVEDDHAR
ncbi:RND superfamily putative drug exporter [Actinocorallia herbida]|uniref:RND superfamily putative drug exporter n=1 Tax=Actinocorallia herbida TaxID=58109 RepID=A0A3N1DCW0_9ACTN|nr:MMPL family transporter [Actinocorallia herbida]ROO90978.1 RND superfamily putative drug exporter [Actinocorallia herbida]